jgi:hypothetical protein
MGLCDGYVDNDESFALKANRSYSFTSHLQRGRRRFEINSWGCISHLEISVELLDINPFISFGYNLVIIELRSRSFNYRSDHGPPLIDR